MKRPRVVLADDHALMISGIKGLLEPHYEVVETVSDGRQLIAAALRQKPEVVVLDISMPNLNGLEAGKQIKSGLPSVKLIFLSMHTNLLYLRKALDVGANGYVLKTGVVEELLEAMRIVLEGGTFVSRGFGENAIENLYTRFGKPLRTDEELSARQREILQLIAEGNLSKEIAHLLGISVKTVEFHRAQIMEKLGARSVADLVRISIENGLVPTLPPSGI